MTIRHLKIFIMVADTGKMSLAAEQMFLSQPTVSQAIRELEEYYEVLLFERLSKKIYITPEGERLLTEARQVVSLFDQMNERIHGKGKQVKLKIGATVTIGSSIMIPVLRAYRNLHPDAEIEVFINNTKKMEESLLKSQLDFAFVEGEIKNKDLLVEPVITDNLVLVCGREHPFYVRENVSIEELENETFILREEGSGTRELFESYMKECNINIKIGWSCITPEAIKKAVIEGLGITVISGRLVEDEAEEGKLHVIKLQEGQWNRNFSMVYHKNKYLSNEIVGFFETVKNMDKINGE